MAMRDVARQMAAEGLTAGGGAMDMAPMAPEQELPEEAAMMEAQDPQAALESGLAMVEEALAGISPDKAEQARQHLEAIRSLAADGEAAGAGGGEEDLAKLLESAPVSGPEVKEEE